MWSFMSFKLLGKYSHSETYNGYGRRRRRLRMVKTYNG